MDLIFLFILCWSVKKPLCEVQYYKLITERRLSDSLQVTDLAAKLLFHLWRIIWMDMWPHFRNDWVTVDLYQTSREIHKQQTFPRSKTDKSSQLVSNAALG